MSQQRITRAADDVETIARRLKEIEDERAAAIAETELPSDVEPVGFGLIPLGREMTLEETLAAGKQAASPRLYNQEFDSSDCNAMTREHVERCYQYNQEFWQPLIDAGVLELVEPGDA